MTTIYGWHFLYEGHKLRDGTTAPKNGKWLEVQNPVICERGLHGSLTPCDALKYAPGPILCLCEFSEPTDQHHDKFVSERRRIVERIDATEMLRYYARMQALSVVHLWGAPDVVLDYLMTGDESIRSAAESAAESAAWSAVRSAARSAAESAAWSAAGLAAWSAAESAAWSAAWSAAGSAAWSAARSAAWSAARSAAWSAARSAASQDFNTLVYECFEGPMQIVGMKGTT